MRLIIQDHPYHYEMQNVTMMFFPGESIQVVKEPETGEGDWILTRVEQGEDGVLLRTVCFREGNRRERLGRFLGEFPSRSCELALARQLFDLLAELTGIRPPWGVLTGVRPIKLLHALREQGKSWEEITRLLEEEYYLSPQKLDLARTTEGYERQILSTSRPDSFSLYLSLPFCPTRCSYCSFVSHSIAQARKLLPDYIRLLQEEIRLTARMAKDLRLHLETIYIGGGTPTTLEADQLARIMETVGECYDLSQVREYTVEAGRPDTITPEKLRAIREGGAGRVSVNPQTFSDQVLRAVGRSHTVDDFRRAYAQAKELDFCVNLDLIAGLPEETTKSFAAGVDEAISLEPGNITIHTLAIKRAADLAQHARGLRDGLDSAASMVDYGCRALQEKGYIPYYLYRQKNTAENLENTGFALPGQEGLYNTFIMDETHTILAVGAGAVTKLRQPNGGLIERIFNFKYPYEYISRFEEIRRRKDAFPAFYHRFGYPEGWEGEENRL